MVLASTPEGTALSKLAEMADKVMEVAAPSGSVASLNTHPPSDQTVAPPPTPPATAADIQELCSEISRLEKLVWSLAQSRSPSRPARLSQRSPTPNPHPGLQHVRQLALLVSPKVWRPGKRLSSALFLVVKRAGRSLAATSVAGPTHPGRLFYVHDHNSS